MEKATFAAGCFWGVEARFREIPGVISTSVGYTGGQVAKPSYEEVCTGLTGHAEAVEITYDERILSYDKLLQYFWNIHDPTTLNRQGPDIGTQYRSVIFYHSEEQRKKAYASKLKMENLNKFRRSIVTEIKPISDYYKAEDYHQQYYTKNKKNLLF